MVTIKDVAALAGVAKPTVSRVLNGSAPVRGETRTRVLAAIDELGYQPSPIARGLARGRLHTIAVIVPFAARPSVVERIRGVLGRLRAYRIPVSIYDVEHRADLDEHLATMLHLRPEGIVVISLHPDPGPLEALAALGIPLVFIDAEAPGFSSIAIDDESGGHMATRHLIELGHRRIGFVGDIEENPFGFQSSHRRRIGYRAALVDAGIELDPNLERTGLHGQLIAAQLADELLQLEDPPTAIVAASDTQALGVLDALRRRRIEVPTAFSVIGFDDIETAQYADLTTIRQPLWQSGDEAARILVEQPPGRPPEPIVATLSLELIERRSTAPAPSANPDAFQGGENP